MHINCPKESSSKFTYPLFKKLFWGLLRISLIVGCFIYSLWKIDLSRFYLALKSYKISVLVIVQLYLFLALVPSALRMKYLSNKRVNAYDSMRAIFLGLGINNVLPGKLGEVAKAIYLRKKTGLKLGDGFNIVFWERFSDLHVLVLLAGISIAVFTKKSPVFFILFGVVAGIWGFLFIYKIRPKLAEKFLRIVSFERLQRFIQEFLLHMQDRFQLRFLFVLGIYAVIVWIFLASIPYAVFWGVAGLALNFEQVLMVVIISSLGMAVPSSPGSVGVYEASIVGPLMWFGIDKEQALAAAIVLHMIQYIPTTIIALLIMLKTGLGIKSFKL